jgi:transglutaminase-like putative cysteine protease
MRLPTRITLLTACFALLLVHPAAPAQRGPAETGQRVAFTLRYEVAPKAGTTKVTLTTILPKTLPGKQKILNLNYSRDPERVFDRDGLRYARFVLNRPGRTTAIIVTGEAELYRRDFGTAARGKNAAGKADFSRWLAHETYLEKNAPEIRKAAKGLAGKDDLETVRNVMRYVTKTLRQGPWDEKDRGALWALQKKRGDCTEFADLFVTLCRAHDVPARFWQGYLTTPAAKDDTPKHDRAEVYLKGYGWVPFDPFHIHLGGATFDELRPNYIYLDAHRRNPVLNNYHFFSYTYEGSGIDVRDSFAVRRQTALSRSTP